MNTAIATSITGECANRLLDANRVGKGPGAIRLLHIIGHQNHGKTTLIVELIPELRRRGLRVGTVKHCGHKHEIDTPGKDSHRHRDAGAETVLAVTPDTLALFRGQQRDVTFHGHLDTYFAGCDLVLIEGDAAGPGPKVEVWRAARGTRPMATERPDILAVISDDAPDVGCPVWPRCDVAPLAAKLDNLAAPRELVPAYILAGGKSTRFGCDKARAMIGTNRLIRAVADAVRPVASALFVVADRPDKYADLGLATIADCTPGRGPLGGLDAAFAHAAGAPWILVLACDLAGVRTEWIAELLRHRRDKVQAVYFTEQPLLGVYHASLRPHVNAMLEGPQRSVHALLERAHKLSLPGPKHWETLKNVNSPEDLPDCQRPSQTRT